jgi:hypothetical protein
VKIHFVDNGTQTDMESNQITKMALKPCQSPRVILGEAGRDAQAHCFGLIFFPVKAVSLPPIPP